MILHIVLNSLLVFLVLALIIEFILHALQIQNPRVRYFCRSLPIVKLPFDLMLFSLYGDSLFINLNPFSCEMYIQEVLSTFLPVQIAEKIQGWEKFIVPSYVVAQLPPRAIQGAVFGIALISLAVTCLKTFQLITSIRYLKKTLQTASPCSKAVFNPQLAKHLSLSNVQLLSSTNILIPFAAYQRYILFPSALVHHFSQEEFEAVVAHELEHLKWKDPLVKVCGASICALFWWIPTRWWLRRLEADQENASDTSLSRYGIDYYYLASALIKVVNSAKGSSRQLSAICHFDTSPNMFTTRISNILNHSSHIEVSRINTIIGSTLCVLMFLCFWMC